MNESSSGLETVRAACALCGEAIVALNPRFRVEPEVSAKHRKELIAKYKATSRACDEAIEYWLSEGQFSHKLAEGVIECVFWRLCGIEFLSRGETLFSVLRELLPEHQTPRGLLRRLPVDFWSAESSWPKTWLLDLDLGGGLPRDEVD